jgi:hypothetical protein
MTPNAVVAFARCSLKGVFFLGDTRNRGRTDVVSRLRLLAS